MLAGTYYKNDLLDFKSGNITIKKGEIIIENGYYGGDQIDITLFDTQQTSRIVCVDQKDLDKAIELGILIKIDKDSVIKEEHKQSEFQIGDFVTDGQCCGIVNSKYYYMDDGWCYELMHWNNRGEHYLSNMNYSQEDLTKIDELNYDIEIKDNKYKLNISKVEE